MLDACVLRQHKLRLILQRFDLKWIFETFGVRFEQHDSFQTSELGWIHLNNHMMQPNVAQSTCGSTVIVDAYITSKEPCAIPEAFENVALLPLMLEFREWMPASRVWAGEVNFREADSTAVRTAGRDRSKFLQAESPVGKTRVAGARFTCVRTMTCATSFLLLDHWTFVFVKCEHWTATETVGIKILLHVLNFSNRTLPMGVKLLCFCNLCVKLRDGFLEQRTENSTWWDTANSGQHQHEHTVFSYMYSICMDKALDS